MIDGESRLGGAIGEDPHSLLAGELTTVLREDRDGTGDKICVDVNEAAQASHPDVSFGATLPYVQRSFMGRLRRDQAKSGEQSTTAAVRAVVRDVCSRRVVITTSRTSA